MSSNGTPPLSKQEVRQWIEDAKKRVEDAAAKRSMSTQFRTVKRVGKNPNP
jgi:hypothetical protein